jgi:flagellar basal-body rod modification protein FlgD
MNVTPTLAELFPNNNTQQGVGRAPEELGQEDFLELMVAQLENQDPTKPMDNFQFLSQLAQFGTVDGIQNLETGFGDLSAALNANQVLNAASLVGKQVVSDSNMGVLEAGEEVTLDATIDLPADSPSVTLYIQDVHGRLVHTRELGAAPAGELKVSWDGTGEDGDALPPGRYRVSAEAVIGGANQGVSAFTHTRVDSVSVDPTGGKVVLNLAGGDEVDIATVKRFL